MADSTETSSLRERFGELLNKNALLAWSLMIAALVLAALVIMAGSATNSIPLSLSGIAVAWILLRILMWLQNRTWKDFGLKRPKSWVRTVVYAIAGTVILHILISFIFAPLTIALTKEPINSSQFDLLRGNPLAFILGLIIVWTLAAFGEEMVFRGYIMHAWAKPFRHKLPGWIFAVLMTSIIFGLGHSYQGITGIILTGIVGIIYALAFFISGRNLWLPILIHGLYDTTAFLIIFLNLDKAIG